MESWRLREKLIKLCLEFRKQTNSVHCEEKRCKKKKLKVKELDVLEKPKVKSKIIKCIRNLEK